MTQGTERLRVFEAVSLLEQCGIQPPMTGKTHGPFRIDPTQWLCNEMEAGRLVFHDHTGLKIESGAYMGHFGLYDETTSIAQLNTWLASIGHLRRIPETACVPTAAVILERHDEDSRPVFRMPLCPAEVPAELLALPVDTSVVCIEEHGSSYGAHYTTAAKLADYIRGRLPAGAPEPASAPAVADREPVAMPAEAVPVPVAGTKKHRIRSRIHPLDGVIAEARKRAVGDDWMTVWNVLCGMAEAKDRPEPLLGYSPEDGLKYRAETREGFESHNREAFRRRWATVAKG